MGKVKIAKKDVWIDMTPMSDVMVLLLTFFMLTSTFVKQEPGQFGLSLSPAEEKKFLNDPMWGVPMNDLKGYLALPKTEMPVAIKKYGIPTDSVPGKTGDAAMSEFQIWVKAAKNTNPDAKIAIKADEKTPYRIVKKIMSELQDMNENRYYLITQYKKQED